MKIFITGMSATGKSTLAHELRTRGVTVVDIDDTDFCHWQDKDTKEPTDYFVGIGKEWLYQNEWVIEPKQLKTYINSIKDDPLVIVGIVENQADVMKLCDKTFLLQVDNNTLLDRLKNRTTNDFAKDESEQEFTLEIKEAFDNKMIDWGATPLDATQPVKKLVDSIINHNS